MLCLFLQHGVAKLLHRIIPVLYRCCANPMMDMEIQVTTVTEFFQHELLDRCRKNPKYSLRAFARQLSLHPGTLSQILRGKRRVSNRLLLCLAGKLDITPDKLNTLLESNADRNHARKWRADIPMLANDVFTVIADWYHFAILELISVNGFEANENWVSKRLGISVVEIKNAVSRLKRLKLLEIGPSGEWLVCYHNIGVTDEIVTTPAMRKLQRQLLEKALSALDEVPVERRDQSSMTMAIDSLNISQARDLITRFRRDLCALLQSSPHKNSVYNLTISLYPLTNDVEVVKSSRSQRCA